MTPNSVAEIVEAVARHHGVTATAILSPSKQRHLSGPRHQAMWLAVELLGDDFHKWRMGADFRRSWAAVVYGHAQVAGGRGKDALPAEGVWREIVRGGRVAA